MAGYPGRSLIAVMLILRQRLGDLHARGRQHRQTAAPTTIRPGTIRSRGPAGRDRRATGNAARRTRVHDTAPARAERT